jgi:hypothetical protein
MHDADSSRSLASAVTTPDALLTMYLVDDSCQDIS